MKEVHVGRRSHVAAHSTLASYPFFFVNERECWAVDWRQHVLPIQIETENRERQFTNTRTGSLSISFSLEGWRSYTRTPHSTFVCSKLTWFVWSKYQYVSVCEIERASKRKRARETRNDRERNGRARKRARERGKEWGGRGGRKVDDERYQKLFNICLSFVWRWLTAMRKETTFLWGTIHTLSIICSADGQVFSVHVQADVKLSRFHSSRADQPIELVSRSSHRRPAQIKQTTFGMNAIEFLFEEF